MWKARDLRLDVIVAIKFLDDVRPDQIERFGREARAVAKLDHPSIVRSTDFQSQHDPPYFVMTFIDGHSLAREPRPLPPAEVRRIVGICADALATAHAASIVHRDLTPANVLIDGSRRVFLSDFGLARGEAESDVTLPSTSVGTPEYWAPEQARGEAPRASADMYALGAVAFELLTDRLPFPIPDDGDRLRASYVRLVQPAPKIADIAPDVARTDPVLAGIVDALLATTPDDRPTAQSVRNSLNAGSAAPSAFRATTVTAPAATVVADQLASDHGIGDPATPYQAAPTTPPAAAPAADGSPAAMADPGQTVVPPGTAEDPASATAGADAADTRARKLPPGPNHRRDRSVGMVLGILAALAAAVAIIVVAVDMRSTTSATATTSGAGATAPVSTGSTATSAAKAAIAPTAAPPGAAFFNSVDGRERCQSTTTAVTCVAAPSGIGMRITVGGGASYLGVVAVPAERGHRTAMGSSVATRTAQISCGSSINGITCTDATTNNSFTIGDYKAIAVNGGSTSTYPSAPATPAPPPASASNTSFGSVDGLERCSSDATSVSCVAGPSGKAVTLVVGVGAQYLGVVQVPPLSGPRLAMGTSTGTASPDITCSSSVHGITCVDDTTGDQFTIGDYAVVTTNGGNAVTY